MEVMRPDSEATFVRQDVDAVQDDDSFEVDHGIGEGFFDCSGVQCHVAGLVPDLDLQVCAVCHAVFL